MQYLYMTRKIESINCMISLLLILGNVLCILFFDFKSGQISSKSQEFQFMNATKFTINSKVLQLHKIEFLKLIT